MWEHSEKREICKPRRGFWKKKKKSLADILILDLQLPELGENFFCLNFASVRKLMTSQSHSILYLAWINCFIDLSNIEPKVFPYNFSVDLVLASRYISNKSSLLPNDVSQIAEGNYFPNTTYFFPAIFLTHNSFHCLRILCFQAFSLWWSRFSQSYK